MEKRGNSAAVASAEPLLIDAGGAPVTVRADVAGSVAEVAVRGRWTRRLQVRATEAIGKCLAEGPHAVLVDLRDLDDPSAASAPTWWAAARRGAEDRPGVQFVLCAPPAAPLARRLHRMGARYHLPMYTDVTHARVAVRTRLPLTDRHQLRLPPNPEAPAVARKAVVDACSAWSLSSLADPGRLVVSELVENARTHAGTEITVTITRRGSGLHLAVCDGEPALPRLLDAPPPDREIWWRAPGLGLRTVHRIVAIWGAMPTATGKVVWAHLPP